MSSRLLKNAAFSNILIVVPSVLRKDAPSTYHAFFNEPAPCALRPVGEGLQNRGDLSMKKRTLLSVAVLPVMLAVTGCDQSGDPNPDLETPRAGRCFVSTSPDYTEPGPYGWEIRQAGEYDVYVPRDAGKGCDQFPLIGFAMGTGVPPVNYTRFYKHFASWGMGVVVDPTNIINLGGAPLEKALQKVYDDPGLGHRVLTTGVIGHSQGGAAVVSVAQADNVNVSAVVGLMPALFHFDVPMNAAGLWIGGLNDLFGFATDPARPFRLTEGPGFIADMEDVGHNVGLLLADNKPFISLSTAWFRCHLAGDSRACSLFEASRKADGACLFPGTYARCEGKNL